MSDIQCPQCGHRLMGARVENAFGWYCDNCKNYFDVDYFCISAIGNKTNQTQKKEDGCIGKEKKEQDLHLNICKELNELYRSKNADYGDSFHDTFLEEGMAMARIRLSDKLNRFKTLTSGNIQKVTDESIRDTLLDLANYAIMTVMEIDIKKD